MHQAFDYNSAYKRLKNPQTVEQFSRLLEVGREIMPITDLLLPQSKLPELKADHAIIQGKEAKFNISSWGGSYVVILTLPGVGFPVVDATCKSFSELEGKFSARNCKILAILPDTTFAIFETVDKKLLDDSPIMIVSDRNAVNFRSIILPS